MSTDEAEFQNLRLKLCLSFQGEIDEFIEFKKVLLMFDSIIQFVEKSVDVDIDTCIKAADLYMRVYYDIARKEEKDEIEKGNFDFNIIMKRMAFACHVKK